MHPLTCVCCATEDNLVPVLQKNKGKKVESKPLAPVITHTQGDIEASVNQIVGLLQCTAQEALYRRAELWLSQKWTQTQQWGI